MLYIKRLGVLLLVKLQLTNIKDNINTETQKVTKFVLMLIQQANKFRIDADKNSIK